MGQTLTDLTPNAYEHLPDIDRGRLEVLSKLGRGHVIPIPAENQGPAP